MNELYDYQPKGASFLFLPLIPPPSSSLIKDTEPPVDNLTCSRVVTGTLLVPISQKGKEASGRGENFPRAGSRPEGVEG